MAIDESGNLWGSGANTNWGLLGNNSTAVSLNKIPIKAGTRFKEITASRTNSYAIDEDGNLWSWGDNTYGQLVDGTTTLSKVPIQAF